MIERPKHLQISMGKGTGNEEGRHYATASDAAWGGVYIETGFHDTPEIAVAALRAVIDRDIVLVEPEDADTDKQLGGGA